MMTGAMTKVRFGDVEVLEKRAVHDEIQRSHHNTRCMSALAPLRSATRSGGQSCVE
jgi:hypothetical protein